MKKQAISLLLAALMLASPAVLASCSENEVNNETEPAQTDTQLQPQSVEEAETEPEEDMDSRQSIPDDLPDVKYDGEKFMVLTEAYLAGFDYTTEILAEDLTGDNLNDAVYNRNVLIEDRFDVKFGVETASNAYKEIVSLEEAGGGEYQLVGIQDHEAQVPIKAHVLLNWAEMPYVNLEKPWHNQLSNDEATVNGKLFAIASDLSISALIYTYATYCNTTLSADYGYEAEDFYSFVKEGTWTIDKVIALTDEMYIDANGNGELDKNDRFGYGYCVVNPADVWATAFGERSFVIDEEGQLMFPFSTQKYADMLGKLIDWHYNNGTTGFYKMNGQYSEETEFLNGTVVMAPLRFLASFNALREMDDTYIILPYPKWDEAQTGYFTNADDKFSLFGVPISMDGNKEFIGTIYEALCAESYKTVYPIYYDTALKGRYSSDPTTAEMVDLIMAGRAFDFGSQFGVTYYYKVRDLINDNNPNTASAFASSEKAANLGVKYFFKTGYDYILD